MASKEELIIKYVARVAAKRDIERLVATAQPTTEGPESSEARDARERALGGIRAIKEDRSPSSEQIAGVEAIILPKIRPVLDVVGGDFHTDHPLWQKLNDGSDIHARLKQAILSVGRIELPGNPDYPYGGTGFVVGDGLIMTNRHVAAIFGQGIGTRSLSFQPGLRAGIDFMHELDGPLGDTLMVKRIVMIHPYWDMALLSVEGLPKQAKPLKLSLLDAPAEPRAEVAAVGYPAFDPRNDAEVQNDLFREVFGVKRLQPGTLGGRENTDSFGKRVPAVRHDCSTLGGNSGSALVDLSSGQVIALHFGGRYEKTNWGVPSSELARDPRVADAGVQFAGETNRSDPPWQNWWVQADDAQLPDESSHPSDMAFSHSPTQPPMASTSVQTTAADGSVHVVVPLHITIRLGRPEEVPAAGLSTVREAPITEAMVSPWHDTGYDDRLGYDPNFLSPDFKIPMPTPADPQAVAKTKDGKSVLPYQNFSIVMHAKRRLALLTASNVTAEARLKKPEAGRDYTRKGLSGLGQNDQERWFADSRLADEFQLPDVFYTKDDGAFDKGHIVRREDVAWGKTYTALRRANGDTYHVTNCSPQVAGFNRSSLGGGDNWGGLENVVLHGAASERYCQFAGPILDPTDHFFVGAGGGGAKLRVKIPSRFWKVVVVLTEESVASYGFVLEQDLSDVPLELTVPPKFVRYMEPLADIEEKASIKFPAIVRNGDQFETPEGEEMAFRAGAKRRSI